MDIEATRSGVCITFRSYLPSNLHLSTFSPPKPKILFLNHIPHFFSPLSKSPTFVIIIPHPIFFHTQSCKPNGETHPTRQMEQVFSSASSDPLQIPSGSITRARAKRFKKAFNSLIQDMWTKQMDQKSTISKKELTMI